MKEKYYLLNNYLPCICNCHESCLRKDLLRRGYDVLSLKRISEDDYYKYLKKLQKNNYLYFNVKIF